MTEPDIAIFGSTGLLGLRLLEGALERGLSIRALARNPSKLGPLAERVDVIVGDYFDRSTTRQVLNGARVALSTVGPPAGRRHGFTPDQFGTALQHLVEDMKELGIDRFVNVASTATAFEGEPILFTRKLQRMVTSLIAPTMTPAKERELAVLAGSELGWTSVRVPYIAKGLDGPFKVDANQPVGGRVDVNQLAGFMLDIAHSTDWLRAAPFVATR